jgi:predicted acylesterase/phospholipase RssA
MTSEGNRALRPDLPFRRPAVILSGGGGLGAYQVGVLKVLDQIGFKPQIVAGLSVGAINAVAWLAHGCSTAALERTWSRIGPSNIGLRWTTLMLRIAGLFVTVLAVIELLLILIGSDELTVFRIAMREPRSGGLPSAAFDAMAWMVVGLLGYAIVTVARPVEDWLARSTAASSLGPEVWHGWMGRFLLAGAMVHAGTWALGLPWPHRFSATVLVLGTLVWLMNRPGRAGAWVRRLLMRLSPESGGRGLWRGLARRRLMESLVAEGDPQRLVSGDIHLMVNAVSVESGRMCYFINWSNPSAAFADGIARALGEICEVRTPAEVIEAAAASSAIPVLFQPVTINGRDFMDAGMFSSQALHAVLADGADAVLIVLMSPAQWAAPASGELHLFEVGSRLLELGNWRDLRTEILTLPAPWSREGDPARICVVEPKEMLPGNLLRFDPQSAAELMRRGEQDAWAALEQAGWVKHGAAPAVAAG